MTVDLYIHSFSEEIQGRLNEIRSCIFENVSEAEEAISYGMPAYKYKGKPLVYYAAYKKHIGFYATPSGHEAFKEALSHFKQGKGSVQFPINEKLPIKLIQEIVVFKKRNIDQIKD